MSKKACQCKKPAECEECPEWIFTFADLVMLMMGFFVILWVLKPPAGKQGASDAENIAQDNWMVTVGEIRKGFGWHPDPNSSDPVDKAMVQKMLGRKNGGEKHQTRETPPGTDERPSDIRPGLHDSVGGKLTFEAGSTELNAVAKAALEDIAEKIRGHFIIVLVKGHASLDDLPDGSTPEQRMALSIKRAQTAVDYLSSLGVSQELLRVQGCSTYEPLRQRAYDSASQAANRRIEIVWTSELLKDRQDPQSGAAAEEVPESGKGAGERSSGKTGEKSFEKSPEKPGEKTPAESTEAEGKKPGKHAPE